MLEFESFLLYIYIISSESLGTLDLAGEDIDDEDEVDVIYRTYYND